jgi:Methylamine utilisation protein MauE
MICLDPTLRWSAIVAAATIFVTSAGAKLYDLAAFRAATANFRILPHWLEIPFAWMIPVIEGSAAVGLLMPAYCTFSAVALSILLGSFTAAVGLNLWRGRTEIDCGCFGPLLRQRIGWWLLPRNAALFAILASALMPASGRAMNWLDGVTAGFAATTTTLLYYGANYLVVNAAALRILRTAHD